MEIKLYTTTHCGYCVKVKEYLTTKGLIWQEFNVAIDAEKRNEMLAKSHRLAVPVLDIDGRILVGFNPTELDKALG